MKKIIAIALTLMLLCGATTVLAATDMATPSKTTGDMTTFEVTVAGKNVTLQPVYGSAFADDELAKAQNAKTLEAYFGEDAAKAIAAIVGTDAVSLDEFMAICSQGYEENMGKLTITSKTATPYEKDEKVAACFGVVKDGVLTWSVYEAVGQEDGGLQFEVAPDTMLALETETVLFALCSK